MREVDVQALLDDDAPQLSRTERRAQRSRETRMVAEGKAKPFRGMFGSGLMVINPPDTLPGQLDRLLPWLHDTLRDDDGAGQRGPRYTLEVS